MNKISRRDFLKNVGLGIGGLTFLRGIPASAGEEGVKISGANLPLKIRKIKETPSICAFCGCGCGIILYSTQDKLIYVEGDPDHPINEGTLCPKANALTDVHNVVNKKRERVPNKTRLTKPLYRAPGSEKWEEKSWDWILSEIAKRVKKTRDETFEAKDARGVTVNRTLAMASFGSASLDNEENYLLHKMFRAWGMINIEHHARL